jgi:hypothetical protein
MAGAFFETFIITEILKSYYNAGTEPALFYYRDKDQKEVDLLIMKNGCLYPLEIKKTAMPFRCPFSKLRISNALSAYGSAYALLILRISNALSAYVCPCRRRGGTP